MSKLPIEDEILDKPLDLLARYRLLCENAGASRASGVPLPRDLQEQLSRIEGELQTRLWLAAADPGSRGKGKPSARSAARADPAPGLSPSSGVGGTAPSLAAPTGATVYCDGACIGNPGPGGYGVVVQAPGHQERVLSEGKARTTNNEMELAGAGAGLKLALSLGAAEITVVSDSEYLVKGMTSWVRGWLRNGWKTRAGDPVKNRSLWEELNALSQRASVTWVWTRGHSGQPENERCDQLAVAAAQRAARVTPR